MVSSIGSTSLAPSLPARVASPRTQDTAAQATAAAASATSATTGGSEAGVSAAPAAAGGGAPKGGAAAASSASASTDYIAEADTNKDRKLSEQERIAYAKKQASEAEHAGARSDAAQQSRAQEVRQAYLPQETSGAQLDTSA